MTSSTQYVPVEDYIVGIPRRRLYRWCREGRIPAAMKIGRRWFVRVSDETPDRDVAAMLASLGFAA